MMSFDEILGRIGPEMKRLRMARHWSYAQLSDEIDMLGGSVSAKTIENIEKASTVPELVNIYWIARALKMTLGELFEFTLLSEEKRAHALLAAGLRRGPRERKHILSILEFVK